MRPARDPGRRPLNPGTANRPRLLDREPPAEPVTESGESYPHLRLDGDGDHEVRVRSVTVDPGVLVLMLVVDRARSHRPPHSAPPAGTSRGLRPAWMESFCSRYWSRSWTHARSGSPDGAKWCRLARMFFAQRLAAWGASKESGYGRSRRLRATPLGVCLSRAAILPSSALPSRASSSSVHARPPFSGPVGKAGTRRRQRFRRT